MKIDQLLNQKYSELSTDKEKALFICEVISFAQKATNEQAQIIEALSAECDELKNNISRASNLIEEARQETSKAKKATLSYTKKKLQISRDRLVAILSTSNSLGKQINENGEKSIMIDMLNNIIASVGIITEELDTIGLWDKNDEKPKAVPVALSAVPIKKKVSKKKIQQSDEEQNKLVVK